ncbi:MAG: SWEET family sugar transporter [Methanobrevibacter sp.]|nr:SWEET family sugar transporter [Candidatus Methanovirga aequatorialis]
MVADILHPDLYKLLIGQFASFIVVVLNFTLLLQIVDMKKRNNYDGFNPIFALVLFINDLSWTIYGFLAEDTFMFLSNLLGTVFVIIILYYILKYFVFRPD